MSRLAESTLPHKLKALKREIDAAKTKTQNTSLEKYEILWDCDECLRNEPPDSIVSLQGKFIPLLVKELVLQEPLPPLRRVIGEWIVGLCKYAKETNQAVMALKSFQELITQKQPSLVTKLTAIECTGAIFAGLGMSVAGLANDTVNLMIKQLKSATPEKRATALATVEKVVQGCGVSVSFIHSSILKAIKPVSMAYLLKNHINPLTFYSFD
jgi:hypothetical protein